MNSHRNLQGQPLIIIPCYRRLVSLQRLLGSILAASELSREPLNVLLSIDGGANDDVISFAKNFKNKNISSEVLHHSSNLGLRNHILWCGDQTEKYGSVIILEDDLMVDPQFYHYARAAVEHYKEDNNIAGIALYSPRLNEHANLPFEPLNDGTSGYFMQWACSWGQAWTAKQWQQFRQWYAHASHEKLNNALGVPNSVKQWSEQSWKKYFIQYLVETGKYFFYPHTSYSTNCADSGGAHLKGATNVLEVPFCLPNRVQDQFHFPNFNNSKVKYDAYWEISASMLTHLTAMPGDKICVDLYGKKETELVRQKEFVISSRPSRNPIKTFALKFKPIELNLTHSYQSPASQAIHYGKSEDLVFDQQDKTYFNLARFFSYFSLTSTKFVRIYYEQVYKRKKNQKTRNWWYRKIRYPFKVLGLWK